MSLMWSSCSLSWTTGFLFRVCFFSTTGSAISRSRLNNERFSLFPGVEVRSVVIGGVRQRGVFATRDFKVLK